MEEEERIGLIPATKIRSGLLQYNLMLRAFAVRSFGLMQCEYVATIFNLKRLLM